jgi:hypothetical protein
VRTTSRNRFLDTEGNTVGKAACSGYVAENLSLHVADAWGTLGMQTDSNHRIGRMGPSPAPMCEEISTLKCIAESGIKRLYKPGEEFPMESPPTPRA